MVMENDAFRDGGNTQACYTITIKDDNVIEPQEVFYVSLTSLPGPIEKLVTINPNVSSVLIIDNDGKTFHPKHADILCNNFPHRSSGWF